MENPSSTTYKNSGPLSLIQSLLIKLAAFGIGVAVVLWFGWSRPQPQANQQRVYPLKTYDVSQEGKQPAFLHSLDINKGTKEEFETLPGIGPVLARRIIERRESQGPFADVEDLKAIDGIGETKFAHLRSHITVNQQAVPEIPQNQPGSH